MTEQHTQGRLWVVQMNMPRTRGGTNRAEIVKYEGGNHSPVGNFDTLAEVHFEADAVELVRRWNAFGPGGAVDLLLEAITAAMPSDAIRHSYECDGVGDFCGCLWGNVRATAAALTIVSEGGGL